MSEPEQKTRRSPRRRKLPPTTNAAPPKKATTRGARSRRGTEDRTPASESPARIVERGEVVYGPNRRMMLAGGEPQDPRATGRHATYAERSARRAEVAELLCSYTPDRQIIRALAFKYNVTLQIVRSDIKKFYRDYEPRFKHSVEKRRRRHVVALERLFAAAVKSCDYRAAAFIHERLCKLDGLLVDKVQVKHDVDIGVQVEVASVTSPAGRTRLIELLSKVNADAIDATATEDDAPEPAPAPALEGGSGH